MSEVRFLMVRDVRFPERGTNQAAGIDFFVPNYNKQFETDLVEKNPNLQIEFNYENDNMTAMVMVLKPGERVLIPSGVKTWMESGTALIAANKSGIASKKGLIFGAQVVDSDYTGEVHISVINTSNEDVIITTGEKLIQFIHTPVLLSQLNEVNEEEFERLHSESLRGEGGFGSTGV